MDCGLKCHSFYATICKCRSLDGKRGLIGYLFDVTPEFVFISLRTVIFYGCYLVSHCTQVNLLLLIIDNDQISAEHGVFYTEGSFLSFTSLLYGHLSLYVFLYVCV